MKKKYRIRVGERETADPLEESSCKYFFFFSWIRYVEPVLLSRGKNLEFETIRMANEKEEYICGCTDQWFSTVGPRV